MIKNNTTDNLILIKTTKSYPIFCFSKKGKIYTLFQN